MARPDAVRLPGPVAVRSGAVRRAARVLSRLRLAAVTVLLTVLVGTLLGGGAVPAAAHAILAGSGPAAGSVVSSAPDRVTLTFSENVALSDGSIRVLDPRGNRVDTGELLDLSGAEAFTYGVKMRPGLPDGTFTVAWQAVSADSHPVSGAFTFSVAEPSGTSFSLPERQAGGGAVGALYGIARYAAYAGFVLLVGGAAFVLACRPRGASVRPVQRVVVGGWVALTVATIVMLLLRDAFTGSGELSDVFDPSGLKAVLETEPGAALASRLLLLGAAALVVSVLFGPYVRAFSPTMTGAGEAPAGEAGDHVPARRGRLTFGLAAGGLTVAVGLAATWATTEHASTGLQPGLAMPLDVLHLLAVAMWLGGLAALLASLCWGPPFTRTAVRRFSRIAFGSVLVLAATGLYQSWRQVGSWSALTSTSFGQLLLVKVGVFAILVGIASFSHRWTARLLDAPAPDSAGESRTAAHMPAQRRTAVPAADPQSTRAVTRTADDRPANHQYGPHLDSDPDPDPDPDRDPDPDPDSDHERAAQLARQRAAIATARRRRERERKRDADPARWALRRSVLVEAGVAAVLLAVTTVLTSTEPGRTQEAARAYASETGAGPRAGAGAPGAAPGDGRRKGEPVSVRIPFDTGGPSGRGTAQLDLDPGHTGSNTLHIRVEQPDGRPLDVPEVKASFTLEAQRIPPLRADLERVARGHWIAQDVPIPLAGSWKISLTVRTSDIDQVTETKDAKIG